MTRHEGEQYVKGFFEQAKPRLIRLTGRFVEDPQTIVSRAETIFDEMLPELAYVEKPFHPLASALFVCTVNLAAYLALKERGVAVHDFGSAMLQGLARAPIPPPTEPETEAERHQRYVQFLAAAEASQQNPAPGEDVFEFVPGNGTDFDFGHNIKSCAIYTQCSKYDAQDVVPYMCGADDVMSDKGNQGLRRTGSIALGASQCDFRFKKGGEPLRLAEQYPDKIRVAAGE